MDVAINPERLWRSLMDLAVIGAMSEGGVRRLAASPEDGAARDLFAVWCREAGLGLTVDRIGNMFARRRGRRDHLPPLLIGSHLDTQAVGGKFDGTFGVLTGLEIVRALNEMERDTDRPIEIVNWTSEEGARFQPGSLGAQVFAGLLPLEHALASTDADGKRAGDELRAIGYLGEAPATGRSAHAYLEAHIEQGPILEEAGCQIGVVDGSMGVNAYEVELIGREAHTGTTPVERRRDALLGAAKIVVAVNELARRYEPDGRATVAHMRVGPNARAVVASHVFFTADCRHKSADVLARMTAELEAIFERLGRSSGLEFDWHIYWRNPVRTFDPECVAAIATATAARGYSHMRMQSGAGHDAIPVSQVVPTAMLFVPSKDGISHSQEEYSSPDDLAKGCQVMLDAALSIAGR
jgi:N-carbamoyl-L-amino-acid hydrolase